MINGEKYEAGSVFTVTENTVVQAVYNDVYNVTLIRIVDGEQKTEVFNYGGGRAYVMPLAPEAPTGKNFLYWRAGGSNYNPGETMEVTGNVTVEAVYEDIPNCTLTIKNIVSGEVQTRTENALKGSQIILPEPRRLSKEKSSPIGP